MRVHTGGLADRATRALNASAYTLGDDVVFRDGLYAPSTHDGRRLLAHELTHVVQQKSTGAAATPDAYTVGAPNSPQEQIADAVATRAVSDPLGSHAPTDLAAQAVRAGGPASTHAHVLQRDEGTPEPPKPYPLAISGATFDEAAKNFADILKATVPDEKSRVVIINGANIRIYDETGAAVPDGSFRLNGPANVPVGVFRQTTGDQRLKVVIQYTDGSYGIGGLAKTGAADFSKDVDRQEAFSALVSVGMVYYVAPQTTATAAQADAPKDPEKLPEFMKFTPKDKANLPAWPAAVLPLSPQVATVHSQGTFMMKVEKNQGVNTLDRVTNIMQRTNFRWEVLKLDPELKVKETKMTTQLDAAREGYKRRLRDLEADRQTLRGEHPEQQSLPKAIVRGYIAEQMTNQRAILAVAGQTVMTAVNVFTTGSSNLSQENIIQIPWEETGDYFVRCLARLITTGRQVQARVLGRRRHRPVFNIEEVAREALPTSEAEQTRADKEFERATASVDELGKKLEQGDGDTAQLDLDYNMALIRVEYLKELRKAPSEQLAVNVAELNMVKAELAYFVKKFPRTNTELNKRVDETAAKLRTRQKELEGLITRADSKLGAEATRTATMPGRLVTNSPLGHPADLLHRRARLHRGGQPRSSHRRHHLGEGPRLLGLGQRPRRRGAARRMAARHARPAAESRARARLPLLPRAAALLRLRPRPAEPDAVADGGRRSGQGDG